MMSINGDSSGATACNDGSNTGDKYPTKQPPSEQLRDHGKDSEKVGLDKGDSSSLDALLNFFKTTVLPGISKQDNNPQSDKMSPQKMVNGADSSNSFEQSTQSKLFYDPKPFHQLMVARNVPMGQPNSVPPPVKKVTPVIDISDENECRGNKAPPLIEKHKSFKPIIDEREEIIPFITSNKPKTEFKIEQGGSRYGHLPRQKNCSNNFGRRDYDNNYQENKNFYQDSNRYNCNYPLALPYPTPSTSSQSFQNASFSSRLTPSQPTPSAISQSTNPTLSQTYSSRHLSHQNPSQVKNLYDRGLATDCILCNLKCKYHENLIAHYVDKHKKSDPPCGLSTASLNLIISTKLPETTVKMKTNIDFLDDFNWIPQHQLFKLPQKCKMPECTFSTSYRTTLIRHYHQHRDELLTDPNPQPIHSVFNCLMCCYNTKDSSEFYEHCTGHTGEYMYACARCGTTAKNKTILKDHFKRNHENAPFEVKSNDKAIPQGLNAVTYGYVCSACGFVQLNKTRVEHHINQCHQPSANAEIFKFDMARPEEPRPVPNPPAPVEPNTSSNSHMTDITRPCTSKPHSSDSISKPPEKRRAAPVKVRGDPRTTTSRQDKLTQYMPIAKVSTKTNTSPNVSASIGTAGIESNSSNSVSETNYQGNVENQNDVAKPDSNSSCNNLSANLQAETVVREISNQELLTEHRPNVNVRNRTTSTSNEVFATSTIGISELNCSNLTSESSVQKRVEILDNANISASSSSCNNVSANLQIETSGHENLDVLRLTNSCGRQAEQIDLPENPNEEISVEFEAVEVKPEIEQITNLERNEVLSSGRTSFQVPSIDDTISRLFANLAPPTCNQSTSLESPDFNANGQPISEYDHNFHKKLANWKERKKIIICSCSEMFETSIDFYNHRLKCHTGERRVSCSECQMKFDVPHLFVDHLWTTCTKSSCRIYSCKADIQCRFITSSQDQFVNHANLKHPNLEWLSCYWCESGFATSISLVNHIKNCNRAVFLNNCFHNSILNNLTGKPNLIENQLPNISKTRELPPPPHHSVVYRCYACSHQSLERQLFYEHFLLTHPGLLDDNHKHMCKYCGNYIDDIYHLVLHIEEKHHDGVNVQERPNDKINSLPNTVLQRVTPEKNVNLVIMEKLKLVENEADSEPGVFSFISSIEWGTEEESRIYKLISLEKMCRYICLSFLVTKSLTFPQAKLQQWRLDKIDFNQLTIIDPIKHIEAIKSSETIEKFYCERKLKLLYKCCGQECIFATDEAAEFCEHLFTKRCRSAENLWQCVYCGEESLTISNLAAHITKWHGSSCYQCPHCIYRSIKEHYVLVHIHVAHPELGEKVKVLKCFNPKTDNSCESVGTPPPLLSIVRPISCNTGDCNFVCWDTANFVNHHNTEHSKTPHIICYLCSVQVVPKESFAAHLKLHKVFDYHCEYCGCGDAVLNNVIVHSFTMHPQWVGKVFVRSGLSHTNKPEVLKSSPKIPLRISEAVSLEPSLLAPIQRIPIPISPDVNSEHVYKNIPISIGTANLTGNLVLTCGYQMCSYSAKSLSDLKNHLRLCEYKQEGSRFYCKTCFKWFTAEETFLEHISVSHIKLQDQLANFFCGVCDFATTDIHLIKIHLNESHNLEFKETTCDVKISSNNPNLRLFVYKPAPVKVVISKSATGSFQSSTTSPLAKKTVGDKRRASNDCERTAVNLPSSNPDEHAEWTTFTNIRKNLIKHLEHTSDETTSNTVEKNVTETVATSLNNSSSLWHYSKTPIYVLPKERFHCPFKECKHVSIHSSHLQAHILIAHDNPFEIPCRHCDVLYSDMYDFQRHLKLHGPQLFRCSYCPYYNYFENVVKGHSLSSHPGLPQNCRLIRSETERACEQTKSLNSEESGNLACDCCNNFNCFSDSSLRKHIIQCLSLENYICNICNKEFSRETDIGTHFRDAHPESTPNFTIGLKPKVEKCLNTLVDDQVAKSRGETHSISASMLSPTSSQSSLHPSDRSHGASGLTVTSTADSSTVNVVTNASSFGILLSETSPADSTELISSTSSLNDNYKKHSNKNRTPSSSTLVDKVAPSVTSSSKRSKASKIANKDDNNEIMEFLLHCPICPMSLKQVSKLKTHLRNHLGGYKCFRCPEISISRESAIKHQKDRHHESNEEVFEDSEREEFINWVIKLLKEICAESSSSLHRPISLVCKRDKCVENFTNLYLFKTHFFEHLRNQKKNSSPSKNVSEATASSSNIEIVGKKSSQAMCPYCDYVAAKWNVMEHLFSHIDFKFFVCPYCSADFKTKMLARKHATKDHPMIKVEIFTKPKPANLVVKELARSIRKIILVSHMEPTSSNENGDYLCNKCAFSTSSLNNIRYHCQNEHDLPSLIVFEKRTSGMKKREAPNPNTDGDTDGGVSNDDSNTKVPCKECGVISDNLTLWMLHFSQIHGGEQNVNESPKKKQKINKTATNSLEDDDSKDQENEKLLEKSTTNQNRDKYSLAFKCSYCSFTTATVKYIKAHWLKKHPRRKLAYTSVKNISTYQCSSCLFKTPNLKEGRKHIRDKHCLKFTCDKCAKMFATQVAVKVHSSFKHAGEEPEISRKDIDNHQFEILLKSMLESSGDKPSSSKETAIDNIESDDEDCVRVVKQRKIEKIMNGSEIRTHPTAVDKQEFESRHKERSTRRRVDNMSLNIPEFSFYGNRPSSFNNKKLTVNTNLKGFRNATISYEHLCEIFNLNARILIKDISYDKRHFRFFV